MEAGFGRRNVGWWRGLLEVVACWQCVRNRKRVVGHLVMTSWKMHYTHIVRPITGNVH